MISNTQPYLYPLSLVDINKKLIPTEFNSFCSIRETVITINFSVNNIMISIQPRLSYPLVNINKKLIPPKLNSPSGIRVMVTPSSVSVLN